MSEQPVLTEATAAATRWVLTLLGVEAVQEEAILSHPGGFAYEIAGNCLGLLPAALVAAAVLFVRVPWRRRLEGAVLGVVAMLAGNLVRLVLLFLAGVRAPEQFGLAHTAGHGLTVAWMAGFLLFWSWWLRRMRLPASPTGGASCRRSAYPEG